MITIYIKNVCSGFNIFYSIFSVNLSKIGGINTSITTIIDNHIIYNSEKLIFYSKTLLVVQNSNF